MNRGIMGLQLIATLLYGFFRRRSQAKEQRRRAIREYWDKRHRHDQTGMIRAKLVAMQRRDPDSFPLSTVPLDEGGVRFLEALCLNEGEDPRESYDSMESGS